MPTVDDWIMLVMERLGVIGVGLLIALENLVPPIPSEVILPMAGFQAHAGKLNPFGVWAAATLGALAGAWVLYGLGARLGFKRLHRLSHRRWFIVASPSDVERGQKMFERHGSWIVAVARCVPVLRSLVSLPAGVAGMPLLKFSALTLIGAGIWNAVFIAAGWHLSERWELVQRYSKPVSTVVIILLVAGLGAMIWRKARHSTPVTAGD